MAPRRLLLKTGLAAVLLATLALAVVQSHRQRTAQAEARHHVRELYLEQGRQHLVAGDWQRALPFLGHALDEAETDVALRFLVGRATAALRGEGLALVENPGGMQSFRTAEYRKTTLQFTGDDPGQLVRADLNDDWTRLVVLTTDGRGLLLNPLDETFDKKLHATGLVDLKIHGGRIAGLSSDGQLSLWQTDTGALLATLAVGDSGTALTFAPDGSFLATLGVDGAVRLWNFQDGSLVPWHAAEGGIGRPGRATLAISPEGQRLAVAGDQATMIWKVLDGKALVSLDLPFEAQVHDLDFGPREELVAVGQPPEVRFFSKINGELTTLLEGHTAPVCCADFSPSGDLLLTASADATARIWDPQRGRLLATVPLGGEDVIHAEYGPKEERIATVHADGTLRVISLALDQDGALELERLRRCFVPWQLVDGRLLPAVPDERACMSIAPGGQRGGQPELPVPEPPVLARPDPSPNIVRASPSSDPERNFLGVPIDLRLHDADLVETLRTFARIGDLNLLVASQVDAKIHAEFSQVPWDQALDAILSSQDLAMAHWEGLLFIFPAQQSPPDLAPPLPQRLEEVLAELMASPGVEPFPSPLEKSGYWNEPLHISLKNMELYEILVSFSKIGGFELQLDGDVQGQLSCELRGVPWGRAFLAILALNNLQFEVARNPLTEGPILRIRRRTPEDSP